MGRDAAGNPCQNRGKNESQHGEPEGADAHRFSQGLFSWRPERTFRLAEISLLVNQKVPGQRPGGDNRNGPCSKTPSQQRGRWNVAQADRTVVNETQLKMIRWMIPQKQIVAMTKKWPSIVTDDSDEETANSGDNPAKRRPSQKGNPHSGRLRLRHRRRSHSRRCGRERAGRGIRRSD